MSIARSTLLWMSENSWMKKNIPQLWFVKKAAKKFMPGETEVAAINASVRLSKENVLTVFTKLGENINSLNEAEIVRDHYLDLIDKIKFYDLDTELSIKITQLGFDLSEEAAFEHCKALATKVKEKLGNTFFIDMEGSAYTQKTLDFFKRLKASCSNVGLCVQAYLYRTEKDLEDLFTIAPSIRLVKGAYKESPEIAYPIKKDVDENYFNLARKLMMQVKQNGVRAIFATHDESLGEKIIKESKRIGLTKDSVEFQMLYGIKTNFVNDLIKRGYKARVLVAYGQSWYPWYMRRLAERPANIWFVLKNLF